MLAPLLPRQRKALAAVDLIRRTTEELIARCKAMVDEEEVAAAAAAAEEGRDYMNAGVYVCVCPSVCIDVSVCVCLCVVMYCLVHPHTLNSTPGI